MLSSKYLPILNSDWYKCLHKKKLTKELEIIAVLSSAKSEAKGYLLDIGNDVIKILIVSSHSLCIFRVTKICIITNCQLWKGLAQCYQMLTSKYQTNLKSDWYKLS